jgi:pimeloyl-ACP methyl ester carboxylesterase
MNNVFSSHMRYERYNQKTKFLVLVCLVVTIAGGFSSTIYLGSASAQSTTLKESTGIKGTITNVTKINIVLVHGIGFDGSSWSKVIPILQSAGHKVIAVQLPLHSLADDVATVKRTIDFIGGPVILVGHSYGGMVITNAAYNNPSVKGLVYIAAVAPNESQSLSNFVDIKKFPKDLLIIDSGGYAYINPAMFAGAIAQDVNPTEADILAAVQTPFSTSILAEKSGPPAWKQLLTWYQVSEKDQASPPALERMFARQMNATSISLPSSHASLVSHPNEIAQLILNATKGVTKKQTNVIN